MNTGAIFGIIYENQSRSNTAGMSLVLVSLKSSRHIAHWNFLTFGRASSPPEPRQCSAEATPAEGALFYGSTFRSYSLRFNSFLFQSRLSVPVTNPANARIAFSYSLRFPVMLRGSGSPFTYSPPRVSALKSASHFSSWS